MQRKGIISSILKGESFNLKTNNRTPNGSAGRMKAAEAAYTYTTEHQMY